MYIGTAGFDVYSIDLLVFIPEIESVYCAVRTASLNKIDFVSSLNG